MSRGLVMGAAGIWYWWTGSPEVNYSLLIEGSALSLVVAEFFPKG